MHLTSLLSSVSGLKFHIEELAAANLVNVIAQGYSGNEYDEEKEYSPQV